jgi:hypothetical protein
VMLAPGKSETLSEKKKTKEEKGWGCGSSD